MNHCSNSLSMKTRLIVIVFFILFIYPMSHAQSYTGLFYSANPGGMHTDQYLNLIPNAGSTSINNWNIYHQDGNSIVQANFASAQPTFVIGFGKPTNLLINSGKIGIGNTAPTSLLDVKYQDGNTNLYRATDQNGMYRWRVDQLFDMILSSPQGNDIVKIGQNNSWFNYSNFGIGTTSPDGLQVNSTLSQETSKGVTNVRFGVFGATPSPRIILDQSGYTPFEIDNAQGRFRIYTPGIERLIINSNGDVGIGSSNPDAKLSVNGTIHSTEVKVDLTVPGPDYVFEKNYDLLSLTELETYINQNKHLPEVPSAKEMEKDGLNLKEMNLILLKKVEELTLHLIDMQKQMDRQEKMVAEFAGKKRN
jgi:hypothetical protein